MSKKSLIGISLLLVLTIGMTGCGYLKYTAVPTSVHVSQQTVSTAGTPFPQEGVINGFEYSIEDGSFYFLKSKKVGYYLDTLDEPNAPYFIIINPGSDKYSVLVKNIDIDANNNMTVTVEFVSSGDEAPGEIIYPETMVSIKPFPSTIKVVNTAGVELERLE